MPTYEYECSKCGHKFEEFQKMSDKPVAPCPKCKGNGQRLISGGAGFIFKGSGFYHTDYKNKNKKEKKADNPPCQKEKSDGCKGCSLKDD